MDKETEKYLKNIIAAVNQKNSDQVDLKDMRKRKSVSRKVKKQKNDLGQSIFNNEGLEITGLQTDYVKYDQVYKSKRFKIKNNLEEWRAFDFFEYACKLYMAKYNEDWGLNRGGNSVEINRILDKLQDVFGFSSNLVMKDYIDYFFDKYIDTYKGKDGFYFSQMKHSYILKSFADCYNYKERQLNYIEEKNRKKRNEEILTLRGISQSFKLNETTLLCNYGLVLSLNWLLLRKRMSKKEAAEIVLSACKKLQRKGMLSIIQKSTELYSPYPIWLPFKKPEIIMNKLEKGISLNVSFEDIENDRFSFLRKKGNG